MELSKPLRLLLWVNLIEELAWIADEARAFPAFQRHLPFFLCRNLDSSFPPLGDPRDSLPDALCRGDPELVSPHLWNLRDYRIGGRFPNSSCTPSLVGGRH